MTDTKTISHAAMLQALFDFKKKHGDAAYCALLQDFSVKRYGEIPSDKFGEVTARCSAGIAGLTLETGEANTINVEADGVDLQNTLNKMADAHYAKAKAKAEQRHG